MLVRSGLLVTGGNSGAATPTLNAAFGIGDYPGDGGGFIRIDWSVSNPDGGEYIEVDYNVTGGAPITTNGAFSAGPAYATPFDTNRALGFNAQAEATVRLYSAGAVLLDTVVLPDTFLPT